MPYTTKQQQAVLHCLESRAGECLSAADLAEILRRNGCPVGLATIYRQLDRLAQAGQVHKVTTAEGALFQFCPDAGHGDCILFKCQACGCVRHLDCTRLQPFYAHLEQAHHLRIDPRGTLFTGLCQQCAGTEDAHGSV